MGMANPVSIVQAIIDLALKIKKEVETFRHNRDDCRKIGEVVATVRAVAEGLRKSVEEEDGGALVGGALKALKQALERAWDLVVACQRKNAVLRALEADAIAEKLRRVCLDVSLNLSAVVLANGAYNTSKLADINGIVAALRADVTYNTWMLAKIMEIVAAIPDAHLHLRQQVARLVQSFSDSTDDDVSYYQNGSTRETKKTDDDASYYQNESTREPKKTHDVARYSTYSPSYAYPSYYDYKAQSYDGYQREPNANTTNNAMVHLAPWAEARRHKSSLQTSRLLGTLTCRTTTLTNRAMIATREPNANIWPLSPGTNNAMVLLVLALWAEARQSTTQETTSLWAVAEDEKKLR